MEDRNQRLKRLQQKLDQQESNLRNMQPKKGVVKRNVEYMIVKLKEEIRKTEYGDPDAWDKDL